MTAQSRKIGAESRALARAAQALREEAEVIERAAAAKADLRAQLETLCKIPEAIGEIQHLIGFGRDEGGAIDTAAHLYGLRADCLAWHWHHDRRYEIPIARFRRDREIMRLAQSGKTNAEIAAVTRLRPKSVSRIIRRELKAGWLARHRCATKLPPTMPVHARLTPPRYRHTPKIGSPTPGASPDSP